MDFGLNFMGFKAQILKGVKYGWNGNINHFYAFCIDMEKIALLIINVILGHLKIVQVTTTAKKL